MTISLLPSTLDVVISMSKAQNAVRTNLSNLCVVVLHDADVADRVRFYSDVDSVTTDWGAGSEAEKAAQAFFSQTPIPAQMAVGHLSADWADIAVELAAIQAAAALLGEYIYGWCLEAGLRIAATQEAAATWALTQRAMMPLVTNSADAYNSGIATDIGSVIKATKNRRAPCLYHNDVNKYPDVSILGYMLAVDYTLERSTVTAKFAQLPDVTPVSLTSTQWAALKAKGYNTYTAMDNGVTTYRDGTTEDTAYFMDSTINLDNFVVDLSTNIYNVFLRNKKVPFTRIGQMMLVDACRDTGNQYTYNGTFADRETASTTSKSGVAIIPAVAINPAPISGVSAAQRASRVGPAIQMVVQEEGAIHSIAVAVQVVS